MCSQERGNDDVITQMYWLAISVEKNFQRIYPASRCGCCATNARWGGPSQNTERKIQFELFLLKWMTRLLKKQKTTEILPCIFWLREGGGKDGNQFFIYYFQFQQLLLSIERERKNSGGCAILSLVYSSSSWMPWELDFQMPN